MLLASQTGCMQGFLSSKSAAPVPVACHRSAALPAAKPVSARQNTISTRGGAVRASPVYASAAVASRPTIGAKTGDLPDAELQMSTILRC